MEVEEVELRVLLFVATGNGFHLLHRHFRSSRRTYNVLELVRHDVPTPGPAGGPRVVPFIPVTGRPSLDRVVGTGTGSGNGNTTPSPVPGRRVRFGVVLDPSEDQKRVLCRKDLSET